VTPATLEDALETRRPLTTLSGWWLAAAGVMFGCSVVARLRPSSIAVHLVGLAALGVLIALCERVLVLNGVRSGRPEYLDWNDITLNAIGAAIGVMLLLHFGLARATRPRVPWQPIATLTVVSSVMGMLVRPPVFRPFYDVAASGFRSHVMSIGEGIACVGVVWLLVHSTGHSRASVQSL
jgi:hypothetical protein